MAKQEHLAQMSAGVEGWNSWRRANKDIAPDLAGTVLRWAFLPAVNLSRTNLEKAVLAGAILDRSDLRLAHLPEADLSDAKLSDALLDHATLYRAVLRGSILRGSRLRNVDLRHANLRGADLRGADLSGAVLDGADFSGARYNPQTIWPSEASPIHKLSAVYDNAPQTGLRDTEFTISFGAGLSADQIKTAFSVIADYYRKCGGVGLRVIDLELVTVDAGVFVHA